MIETIIKCDKCGKSGAKSYKYTNGSSMDASGNGYETNWEYRDFCFEHLIQFIRNSEYKIFENLQNKI